MSVFLQFKCIIFLSQQWISDVLMSIDKASQLVYSCLNECFLYYRSGLWQIQVCGTGGHRRTEGGGGQVSPHPQLSTFVIHWWFTQLWLDLKVHIYNDWPSVVGWGVGAFGTRIRTVTLKIYLWMWVLVSFSACSWWVE